MTKIIRSIALCAISAAVSVHTVAFGAENEPSFSSPESVLLYNDKLFVSNVGVKLDPTGEDGDGYISQLNLKGEILNQKFSDVILNAPKGMSTYGGVLYVADINRVVGLDLNTKKKVFEVSLKQFNTSFLNDIAVTENGVLYVSATDVGDIYQINTNLAEQELSVSRLPVGKLPGPNGLAYDRKTNTLWIASFGSGEAKKGELGKLDLSSFTYKKITSINGMFDGIALISDQKAILSDWVAYDNSGKIIELDIVTGKQKILFEGIGGPADFAYLGDSQEIVIPKMMESKVSIQSIK